MENKKKSRKSTAKTKADSKKSTEPVKGAGDAVKKLTQFLGVDYLIGKCGGCEERREILNSKFPNLKAFQMTADQKKIWKNVKENGIKKDKVPSNINSLVAQLYNDVFKPTPRVEPITCGSCFGKFVKRCNQLDKVYYNETKK